jgi:hypothetical protein
MILETELERFVNKTYRTRVVYIHTLEIPDLLRKTPEKKDHVRNATLEVGSSLTVGLNLSRMLCAGSGQRGA